MNSKVLIIYTQKETKQHNKTDDFITYSIKRIMQKLKMNKLINLVLFILHVSWY